MERSESYPCMLRLINHLQPKIKHMSSIFVIVVPTLTWCPRRDTKQHEKNARIRVNQMFHRHQRRDRHSVSTSDATIQPRPDATGAVNEKPAGNVHTRTHNPSLHRKLTESSTSQFSTRPGSSKSAHYTSRGHQTDGSLA